MAADVSTTVAVYAVAAWKGLSVGDQVKPVTVYCADPAVNAPKTCGVPPVDGAVKPVTPAEEIFVVFVVQVTVTLVTLAEETVPEPLPTVHV